MFQPATYKPKICYILPEYNLAAGSHFYHLYELLERSAKNLDIFLVIERSKGATPELPFRCYRQKFSFMPLRVVELFLIFVFVRLHGYRFFYTHYSFAGAFFAWFVARMFGGINFYWNCGMPWLYSRGWFEEVMFHFALKHSILVTGTEGLLREYQQRYGLKAGNSRVLPNWIDTRRFSAIENRQELKKRLDIPEQAKAVLFVHRLSRRKGAHKILPIAERVAKKIPGAIFLIVGSGPEQKNLEFRIHDLGLGQHVRLAGEVPNKDIPQYFAAADVFFMPSEEEGFPHVLLESMAAGVPYAASDVGGVREITPAVMREYLVPSGDIAIFSAKIVELLEKSPLGTKSIIDEEREWVKRYDIEEVLPKFAALFP